MKINLFIQLAVCIVLLTGCASTMAMVALADPLINMEEQCTSQAIASNNAGAHGVGVDDLSSEMIAKLSPVMYRSVTKEMCKCMGSDMEVVVSCNPCHFSILYTINYTNNPHILA